MNRETEADWERFAKGFRKDLAIKRIKAQPFFRPLAPHLYEGAQWAGIDMAQGYDQTVVFEFNRIELDPESIRIGNEIKVGCTKGKLYGTRCKSYLASTRKGADAPQPQYG